jgi:hypothetical protein
MGSREEATESYLAACRTIDAVGKVTDPNHPQLEIDKAVALGRNILREELGWFGPWEGPHYNLSEAEKSLILAHCREDIAATHALATAAFKASADTRLLVKRNQNRLNILIALLIATLVILLIKL